MTFCRMCGKLLQNVRFDPSEIVLCQKCADTMKGELVRVVRCKDCKHGDPCNDGEIHCEKDIGTIETSVHKPDWFCADGEKAQE